MTTFDPKTICLVTVTHFPEPTFFARMKDLAKYFGGAVIVDNASPESTVESLRALGQGYELILNKQNCGLAGALNQAADRASQHNFSWVYLIDQDTQLENDFLKPYEYVIEHTESPDRIAVIGNNYLNLMGNERFSFNMQDGPLEPFMESKAVITAGSLVSLPLFRETGPFREDFFIDLVDTEYCFRARRRGYRVLITTHPVVLQRIGGAIQQRTAFGNVHPSNHSPGRRYYMSRNLILLFKGYGLSDSAWLLTQTWNTFKMTLKIILYEKMKKEQLKNIFLGLLDGISGRSRTVQVTWPPEESKC